MTNTISMSMTMTTNLILNDFVTSSHQHYNVWDDPGLRKAIAKDL